MNRPRMSSTRSSELVVVAGQSRSGKTWSTAKAVARERSLLVWDSMGEFTRDFDCRPLADVGALRDVAIVGKSGRYSCPWPVHPRGFEVFCRLAWVWIRAAHQRGRSVALVVEELADVTNPGKAPIAWGEICRKGLRFGPRIYALTQRPAESDKTVLGNATRIRCHAMVRLNDRKAMALDMGVDRNLVDRLDLAACEWIELDLRSRELRTGGMGRRTRKIAQPVRA